MKKLITMNFLLILVMNLQVVWAQNDNSIAKTDSLSKKMSHKAIDNLKLTVHFLEDILHTAKDTITNAELKAERIREYFRQGSEMETMLANNFSVLHPRNETMKTELTREFHFIMQSVALYHADFQSENANQELNYLTDKIPKLIDKLNYMITYHQHTDWDKQKKIDELNGYLQDAYGNNTPIQFSVDGIAFKETNSVRWIEVKNMIVDRNKNEVCISTHSSDDIKFGFTEEQYTQIASVHVHFLAFLNKLKK